jgi:hypothetical protein
MHWAWTGASVLVSMPSRREVTSMDATIDNRSTRLIKAFALRPTLVKQQTQNGFAVAQTEIYSVVSMEGYGVTAR